MLRSRLLPVVGSLLMLSVLVHGRRASGDSEKTIAVGNLTRKYLLHVPESVKKGSVPLVLVFHGGGGHARNMPKFTGFDELADKESFVVAYPDSLNTHWNDTRGLSPADDVAFIRALIAQLERTLNIDPQRVYATGISNGGFFVQRLACDLTDKIAAVASVAATMPDTLVPVCKPSRPSSVLFIQGTKDPLVHIEGGAVAGTHGRNVSLAEAVSFWRNFDATSSKPETKDWPDTAHDGTTVHRDVYEGGKQGTEVVVYTIDGGGHTWPNGMQYLPKFLVGKVTHNLDATQTIWQFFQHQRMP